MSVLCGGVPQKIYIRCLRSTRAWTRVPLDVLNHNQEKIMEHNVRQTKHSTSRRSFLRKGFAVGGAGAIGAGLLANGLPVFAFSPRM